MTGIDNGNNAVLVKYNSSGAAQWARTADTGSSASDFRSVTADGSNGICAGGYIYGSDAFSFGGQIITGTNSSGKNISLVKYSSSGDAQWARTVSAGSGESSFLMVTTDTSNNVYAAGFIDGTGTYTLGDLDVMGTNSSSSALLVEYNSSGTVQWARTASEGPNDHQFNGIAIDGSSNIFAAGQIYGTDTFTFGNESVNGTSSVENVLLVKYQ